MTHWMDYASENRALEASNTALLQRVIDLERALKATRERYAALLGAAQAYQCAVRNLDGVALAELRLFAILDETREKEL